MALLTIFGNQSQLDPSTLTGLELWLDASDSSTVLEGISPDDAAEDGDTVRQWSDKSGNGRHAVQATAGSRPVYRATGQNSKGVIEFDGTADHLTIGSAGNFNFLHNGTDSLVLIVLKVGTSSNPNAYYPILDSRSGTSSKIGYTLDYEDRSTESQNNTLSSVTTRGTGGQFVCINASQEAIVPNQFSVVMDRLRATNATAVNRSNLYVNGTIAAIQENTSTATASSSNHTELLTLGRLVGASLYMAGSVAEVIICSNPNTDKWNRLIGYVADKWGITVDLFNYSTLQRISAGTSAYDGFPEVYESEGTLVALFRSATAHGSSKGTTTRAYSTNSGSTWATAANVITDATLDVGEAPGIVLSNGDMLVAANLATVGTPNVAGDAGVYRSTDQGATFSQVAVVEPEAGHEYWYPFGQWRQVGSVIYAPIYQYRTSNTTIYSEVWKTEDEGETWTKVSTIGGNYNETAIINTGGNNWLAVARAMPDSNKMAYFTSTDNMATWSAATLCEFGANAVSPCLFSWNNQIHLWIGDRNGRKGIKQYRWTGSGFYGGGMVYLTTTANDFDYGYPSCYVDSQGNLQVVFYDISASEPGVKHYKITRG